MTHDGQFYANSSAQYTAYCELITVMNDTSTTKLHINYDLHINNELHINNDFHINYELHIKYKLHIN